MLDRLDAEGRLRLGGILPQFPDKRPGKGYLYVMLRDGQRRRKAPVAVLVLEAHRELRPGAGYEACHGPAGRTENHLWNLRWDTKAANLAEMWESRRERAVTGQAASLSQETDLCHKTQVRQGGVALRSLSQLFVTSARKIGTGRSPSILTLRSFFPSLKPSSSTVRNQPPRRES
jgi:hypothetical protein